MMADKDYEPFTLSIFRSKSVLEVGPPVVPDDTTAVGSGSSSVSV